MTYEPTVLPLPSGKTNIESFIFFSPKTKPVSGSTSPRKDTRSSTFATVPLTSPVDIALPDNIKLSSPRGYPYLHISLSGSPI